MFFVLLIVEYGFAYMQAILRPHACFRAIMCERYAQETYTGNVHTDTYML